MASVKDLSPEQLQELRNHMRHSAAHVLAEAVLKVRPNAKLTIGPPIEDGFYYDFDVDTPFTPEDLSAIEKEMDRSIRANTEFVEREVTREDAMKLVSSNPYKVEILEGIPPGTRVTFCSHSNGAFEDLCRGGHVHKTGDIKAFKLLSTAGAYWRGDEHNRMLQRIYGTAWESKDAQADYLHRREEAEKRDHRRLGRELGLFFFDPIAPASPFFLPKGAFIVNALIDYVRDLYQEYGYKEVITPQIFNTDLWRRSGHYENYLENMFFINVDEQEYGVKPMNCPAAAMLFAAETHSYRELPLRYADFGRLHRYERSGVTHGLTRVRSFSQDDAHIFCALDQVQTEVHGFLDMLTASYRLFGFENVRYNLSLRPEKRVGTDEMWDRAEKALESVLADTEKDFNIMPGEGAFYGPKIDVFVPDAIGREWQLGTVQLDFNQPERFDLEYAAEDGTRQRPVMVHRAMLGSIERFLGVLIEHLGGAFPLWIAPVQAVVIPIADRHIPYAEKAQKRLADLGLRVEVNSSNDRMNAKIRAAQLQKVPYMLVVGDREEEDGAVAVRTRSGGNLGAVKLDELGRRMVEEAETRSLTSLLQEG